MLVRAVWPRHYLVRTCGLFGRSRSGGKRANFVDTMLSLASDDEPIKVVDDQVLTPTHAADLAVQVARLVASGAYGTYHATSQGQCSWYEFAAEIFRQAGLQPALERQGTAEAGRAAARPRYSVLDNLGLRGLGIDVMPDWRRALVDYLSARSAWAS
jgi:dTDP-4-dehydrorhamnose reductase